MKIVIPGGSGHLGTILTNAFRAKGHEVVILSRGGDGPFVPWDGKTLGAWVGEIDGADVVINLAGRSVDCRYDDRTRAEIMNSRVDSTRVIGEAISRATFPPQVWLQMSTATIYSHRYQPADELTPIAAEVNQEWQFSIDVARAWETALDEADTPHTRKVKLRTAMVMAAGDDGPFALLRRHVRLGFGRFGDGRQYMSWIHEADFVRAVEWLIEHDEVEGAVNLAAPEPLPNAEFMRVMKDECGGRWGIPSSGWILELGACLFRTEPELVLKSRYVVPSRLTSRGFQFEHPQWSEAAHELSARRSGGAEGSLW